LTLGVLWPVAAVKWKQTYFDDVRNTYTAGDVANSNELINAVEFLVVATNPFLLALEDDVCE